MKLKERILEKLTILYLKFIDAKFKKRIIYSYKKYSKNVFIFSSKGKKGGQTTPWNTIIISDKIFEKYSKNVRDFIFLHEFGHTKLNVVLRILFYISIVPLSLFFIYSLFATFFYTIILISSRTEFFISFFMLMSALIVNIIFGLIVMIISWSCELYAEIFAIKTMGREKYLKAIKETEKGGNDKNLLSRFFDKLLHPTHQVIMFFYEKFN